MKKTHFIFDLDDTLTNSYEFNQQMFVDTFKPYSTNFDEVYVRDLHYRSRGKAMHLQFEEALKHLQITADPMHMVKENEQLHINQVGGISIFDDVKELLELLKSNNKLISLCTNRQSGSLLQILKNNGLENYFENVISCIDAGYEKPDPYCLNALIEKYTEPKESYLYFGDSKTDHDFAQNAGIDFIIIDQYLNKKKFFKVILQAFF